MKGDIMLLNVCVFVLVGLATLAATSKEQPSCGRKNWQCNDGSCIRSILKCDGQADCSDGSDESNETCSSEVCQSEMFQCTYGACIDSEGLCNGETDCVDGSDEDNDTCHKSEPTTMAPTKPDCETPPTPDHGYIFIDRRSPEIYGSDSSLPVLLSVLCDSGYKPSAFSIVYCRNGIWENDIPQCVIPCNITRHPSFEYYCPTKVDPARKCEDDVLSGATVVTECKDPSYFSPNNIKCSEGKWDRNPVCKPECGRVTQGRPESSAGDRALHSPAPWHATIYSKLTRATVCGGSLISSTVVVSAAHCFWDSAVGLLPVATYRVVAGTTRRQSTNNLDKYTQYRDVNDVDIPNSFDGTSNTLEYDIALVTVITPFQFSAFVAPACLDFDLEFNERQLSESTNATFASWDEETGLLKPLDLPFVDAADCSKRYSAAAELNITRNQICAEKLNGTAGSRSSAGTGLAFVDHHNGVDRFYLRGVASVGAHDTPLLFTQILKHKIFIERKLETA